MNVKGSGIVRPIFSPCPPGGAKTFDFFVNSPYV